MHQVTQTVHWEKALLHIHWWWKTGACTMAPLRYYWEYCPQPHFSQWILYRLAGRTWIALLKNMIHLFHTLSMKYKCHKLLLLQPHGTANTQSSGWTLKMYGSAWNHSCQCVCQRDRKGWLWGTNPVQTKFITSKNLVQKYVLLITLEWCFPFSQHLTNINEHFGV